MKTHYECHDCDTVFYIEHGPEDTIRCPKCDSDRIYFYSEEL